MKLIVISNPVNLKDEHKLVSSFFEAGLEYFHLRKPEHSEMQMEEYLQLIPEKYYNRIMLHSHYSLAEKFNLKGIHNSNILSFSYKEGLIASASIHSINELQESEKFNYVFLSPVFDSISKVGYKSNFDLKELKQSLQFFKNQEPKTEVIALGGIDEENIAIARKTGFDGVAVLGAIWEVYSRSNSIQDTIEKFKIIQAQCQLLVHTP